MKTTQTYRPIRVWLFEHAPKGFQALSQSGGDEDWVALVPPEYETRYIPWLDGIDTCNDPEMHVLQKGLYKGWRAYIGCHA